MFSIKAFALAGSRSRDIWPFGCPKISCTLHSVAGCVFRTTFGNSGILSFGCFFPLNQKSAWNRGVIPKTVFSFRFLHDSGFVARKCHGSDYIQDRSQIGFQSGSINGYSQDRSRIGYREIERILPFAPDRVMGRNRA